MKKKSLLRTNQRVLECLELAVSVASQYCEEEDKGSIEEAKFWVENMRKELDEPLLKTCSLSQILKCSNEYFELCDEKDALRKELSDTKKKVNVLLVSMTANKIQALA
jgi:hypothetical protein